MPLRNSTSAFIYDVLDIFVAEGYSKKESYKIMSNLTEEQLEEINEAVISGTIATVGAGVKSWSGELE